MLEDDLAFVAYPAISAIEARRSRLVGCSERSVLHAHENDLVLHVAQFPSYEFPGYWYV